MRHSGWLLGTACAFTFAVATDAFAAEPPARLAVVIGNQDYSGVPDLLNAKADAERMAEIFTDLGYSVFSGIDLDRQSFEALLRQATINVQEGAEIVFFYAGHGIQIGRRNYLLPTDVSFDSIYDLPVEAVTLDRVVEVLSAKGNVHVAIIDACRDNPFPGAQLAGGLDASLFETRTGFDVMRTPLNSLMAFSTAPGEVAFDGPPGGNSPYVTAITNAISTKPAADVTQIFSSVREQVFQKTDGQQVPWESSTLVRPYHFRGAATVTQAVASQEEAAPETSRTLRLANVDLPDEIALRVEYDRSIDLVDAVAAAIAETVPMDVLATLELAAAPGSGSVRVGEGLSYVPQLQEEKSRAGGMTKVDAFTLTSGDDDVMRVTLQMEVNACDLHAGDVLDPGGVGLFRLANEIEVGPALVACRAAVEADPEETRFIHQLGRAVQASGDYEEAFRLFEQARAAGYQRANYAVARLLTSPQVDRRLFDVPEDRDLANVLLEEGVRTSDPFSLHLLGRYLLREGESDADRERGFDLLDRAAELGHTYSMNELGIYFLTEDSSHYIPERGLAYLQGSADRDDIYGFHNLGIVALFGLDGSEPDLATAASWFLRGADGGHPQSPSTLGRMIVRGQLDAPLSEAVRYYDIGLDRGDAWGGVNAANMILRGEVGGFEIEDALVRAAKAAELSGDEPVGRALGLLEAAESRDLARAVQRLLKDLGQSVSIDGAIGPQTRGAISALLTEAGLEPPANDPRAQLSALAKLWWLKNPVRSDVF
ncbi:MAG: caspase family protein [Pseudomonadota bacterium]